MKQCGNEVLTPENEDEFTVDVLYNILCRQESSDIPLPQRVQNVLSSYIAAGKDTDAIPCTEFFAPRTLDFTHAKYICVDGQYRSYLLIPSYGYKSQVAAGWLSLLVNAGDGIDIDLFLTRQPKERMVNKLGQQLRINRSKIREASDKLKSELETQYDCHVWVLAQDLSQPDAAYEVFNYTLEKNITIDALVNNAGFGDFGNFWEVDAQRQTDLLQVNIMTLVQLTRYFLPGMVERRHGSVLNLSSVAAFSAGPRMCLYYASKEFVRSFSEAVAEEVRSTGVTVTALCPGPTATGFEQAAQMKNSHMFSMFKPASAAAVAEAGFRAAQKGKTLRYCGWPTHTVSIAARLLPRSVCRRFMMKVNG